MALTKAHKVRGASFAQYWLELRMPDLPDTFAPGWPGIPVHWTSSAKSGVGTAVSRDSRVRLTSSRSRGFQIVVPPFTKKASAVRAFASKTWARL
jgi:hypothetical protein